MTPGLNRGAFVIVLGEFGHKRGTGRFKKCDQGSDQDGKAQQIEKQTLAAPVRGLPQQVITQGDRQGAGIHERVSPAQPTAGVVGPVADNGVADRIHQQRDQQGGARQSRLQSDHRAVEQQQKIGKTVVLDAIGHRTQTVGQLYPQRQRTRAHRVAPLQGVTDPWPEQYPPVVWQLLFGMSPKACTFIIETSPRSMGRA